MLYRAAQKCYNFRMNILAMILLAVAILALLCFYVAPAESRFEIARKAEKNRKYAALRDFLEIYPGLFVVSRILAAFFAVFFVVIVAQSFGFVGGFYAFFVLALVDISARLLRDFAQTLVEKNFRFFTQYFAFARAFNRFYSIGDPPKFASIHELFHAIEGADFLEPEQKSSLKNSLEFREKTAKNIMVPRAKIHAISAGAKLTPVFIDDLYKSGLKIFPVENRGEFVGLLFLDDMIQVDGQEKNLREIMRKLPESVDESQKLPTLLDNFAKNHATLLPVKKAENVVGLVTLSAVAQELFGENSR